MARTYTDPESIAVPKGDRFAIELTGNAVGGYEWELVDADGALLLDTHVEPGDGGAAGAAGRAVFTFELQRDGQATLAFALRRAWEGEPLRTHHVRVATDQPAG